MTTFEIGILLHFLGVKHICPRRICIIIKILSFTGQRNLKLHFYALLWLLPSPLIYTYKGFHERIFRNRPKYLFLFFKFDY